MVRRRIVSVAGSLCAAMTALSGCASTIAGHGSGAPGPLPTDARGLATLIQSSVASVTSVHITFDVNAGGQSINAVGDEALIGGRVTAFDLTETVTQTGTTRLRVVGGKTYVGLPPALNKSGKPWALVTATSSDAVIRSMNTAISDAQNVASLATPSAFAAAAKSVKLDGPDQIDGAAATHYSIVVELSKLPADFRGLQDLIAGGVTTLPVELWVDGEGRPVKVTDALSIQGQSVSSQVGMSKYNAPVHITAPPPDQVSTS